MVPDLNDPIWMRFINSDKEYDFTCLATKMLYTRIKQLIRAKGEEGKQEAVKVVHEFFVKNSSIALKDLELLK